jgi:hypothetical protein
MFVILAGVASFVSAIVGGRFGAMAAPWALTWPVVWLAVGVVLLLSTTGNLSRGPLESIGDLWPWLAVGLGLWFLVGAFVPRGAGPTETLELPLAGVTEAAIRIRFGAGDLATRTALAGRLVDGTFAGGVTHRDQGPGRVNLEQDTDHGWPWLDRRSNWSVGLTAEVPLDLRVEAGASRNVLDLGDLRLRSLDLRTGASDTKVLLPRAAGASSVRVEAGAASVNLEVPQGVAARIRSRVVFGSHDIDQTRFPPVGGGYESPDYASAANRVDIDVQGGVGSLRVR